MLAGLRNCIIHFEIAGFTAYKTHENNFNEIRVYVNKKDNVNNVIVKL